MDANVFASGLCVVGFIHRFLGLVGLRLLLRVFASLGVGCLCFAGVKPRNTRKARNGVVYVLLLCVFALLRKAEK